MPRTSAVRPGSRRAASDYLQQLLLKPGVYRHSWQQFATRERQGTINQLAVAEVLARHLRAAPRTAADAALTPHQLKDTVSRALTGRLLSKSALTLFIEAFGISEPESGRLWRLWNGSATVGVMTGSRAYPVGAEHDIDATFGQRRHQTLSLHDHIWVGPAGRIDRVRIMQVIEAIAEGVDRIPVLCDPNVATVKVGQGCKQISGPARRISADVLAIEISLARKLDIGETLSFEYLVSYQYPGDAGDPAERQYRRAVVRQLHNLDMRVEFHPERLPAGVWWAHWDGTDGSVLESEPVSLDSQYSVHRYLHSLEKTVAGFYWDLAAS
ncbi:MAG: hypothetical protein J2P29_04485 [Actinobacteria bacterium]|nr:hypothetical protein [Actinomycetota bacterium]